jgi:hypothetical protein
MTASLLEQRFRVFLLSIAAFLCVGTVIELWLTEHTAEPIQFVPFGLCALGFIVILAVLFRPTRATISTLRVMMGALMLGSLVGVYEHLMGNWEVVLETKPNLAAGEMFWEAVRGAAPMLAPGILVLVAVLALAATYYHPALGQRTSG